ncbi:predicted protein, partial [Arabidopsis lyrata subsp. lyrata]
KRTFDNLPPPPLLDDKEEHCRDPDDIQISTILQLFGNKRYEIEKKLIVAFSYMRLLLHTETLSPEDSFDGDEGDDYTTETDARKTMAKRGIVKLTTS